MSQKKMEKYCACECVLRKQSYFAENDYNEVKMQTTADVDAAWVLKKNHFRGVELIIAFLLLNYYCYAIICP